MKSYFECCVNNYELIVLQSRLGSKKRVILQYNTKSLTIYVALIDLKTS